MKKILAFIARLLETQGQLLMPPPVAEERDSSFYCLNCGIGYQWLTQDMTVFPKPHFTFYKQATVLKQKIEETSDGTLVKKVTPVVTSAVIFALCEKCWFKLCTGEKRLPFYEEAMTFQGIRKIDIDWSDITYRVLNGE